MRASRTECHILSLIPQSYKEQSDKLAGPIGLLKQYVTRTARETAEDATQIFGGRGITATGMGRYIENVSSGSGYP
jgi:alkylation response protein AidB-like acyl-CoA dehydrogenase